MQTFRITLEPKSAFGTPLKGDTLFGQLCWAVRNRFGENILQQCLDGYNADRPYAVLSDAFPRGYLPLPKLPGFYYESIAGADRKAVKKRCWLPEEQVTAPLSHWLGHAKTPADIAGAVSLSHPQPHNTINRHSNTTGDNGFAPYQVEQFWHQPGAVWQLWLLLDEQRLSGEDCKQCLRDIGQIGFGRDASIGLGKFELTGFDPATLPAQADANASLTLAPCAPQGRGYAADRSFYQLFTRFGRHGDAAVHQQGRPFKNPVLLAQTGGLFGVAPPASGFIGQGLGGDGSLSLTLPETVQQGYAPVVAVHFSAESRL
ncbi:MAG: CRISPR-associated protein Csm7 [Methylomonas sp.]|nr:CRISPR-associated protein Csm7 [Methylomonas sp.]